MALLNTVGIGGVGSSGASTGSAEATNVGTDIGATSDANPLWSMLMALVWAPSTSGQTNFTGLNTVAANVTRAATHCYFQASLEGADSVLPPPGSIDGQSTSPRLMLPMSLVLKQQVILLSTASAAAPGSKKL